MTSCKDDQDKSSLKVDLGASAKLEVKTEIPAQSSGRLLDALTDIIRPFSESRGLRADQIRLQREDVLIEIARKAKERLAIEHAEPQPLPTKFMVPFLEKASLEDMDSEMIDRWADLLASASQDPKGAHPKFVQILSELTGREVALLRKIALNGFDECPMPYDTIHRNRFSHEFEKNMIESLRRENTKEVALEKIDKIFQQPGIYGVEFIVFEGGEGHGTIKHNKYIERKIGNELQRDLSLDVLSAVNVIDVDIVKAEANGLRASAYYARLTSLGVELLKKCDHEIVSRLKEKDCEFFQGRAGNPMGQIITHLL